VVWQTKTKVFGALEMIQNNRWETPMEGSVLSFLKAE
jgi:hypothetical protein